MPELLQQRPEIEAGRARAMDVHRASHGQEFDAAALLPVRLGGEQDRCGSLQTAETWRASR